LLPNDLIIVRNYRDDEEKEWDIKRMLERQRDLHLPFKLMYKMHTNSEFGCSTYARKEDEIYFPMKLVSCPTKIRFNQNCQNKFNF
jgi:hypothetical protein